MFREKLDAVECALIKIYSNPIVEASILWATHDTETREEYSYRKFNHGGKFLIYEISFYNFSSI